MLLFICVRHCMGSFLLHLLEPHWEALCSGSDASALRLHLVFIFRPQLNVHQVFGASFLLEKSLLPVIAFTGVQASICLR